MKAAQFAKFGAVTRVVEVAEPSAPEAGEVTVAIEASPINPSDLVYIEGRYFRPVPLPFCPGSEAVACVIARGSDVRHIDVGDRVIMLTVGNWTQQRTVPASDVVKITAAADPLQLAMLRVNPGTAWFLLEHAAMSAGDWLIQNAANSALASLVIRFAREKGLRTVNLVRRREAVDAVVRAGGDVVLETGPDLPDRVQRATGGAPIRLGLDAIAGDETGAMAACMAVGGVIATYGMLSNEPCRISPHDLLARELTLVGFRLRGARNSRSAQTLHRFYNRLAQRLVAGETFTAVRASFPLEEIDAALREAASGKPGKVLLLPNGTPEHSAAAMDVSDLESS